MRRLKPEVDQGVEVGVCNGKHVAASATIATVGAAKLFVLLMAKRDTAVPPIASGNVDIGFVYEFHGCLKVVKPRQVGALSHIR